MEEIRYSIKDLENFTKIKAHTIRIWEQRYGMLEPKRTDTNIRYYNEKDLKKILNINLLYNSGMKVSKIALLSDEEIILKAKSLIFDQPGDDNPMVNDLVLNIMSYNVEGIKNILCSYFNSKDIDSFYESLILPMLVKLGELWQVNSIDIMHEHLFSNAYKNFIISKIYQIPENNSGKKAILFLHDNEEHELSLLLAKYILKKAGYRCCYFGQKVPVDELEKAVAKIKPDLILTNFTARISEKKFKKIEEKLSLLSTESLILVSGGQLQTLQLTTPSSIVKVNSMKELREIIKKQKED